MGILLLLFLFSQGCSKSVRIENFKEKGLFSSFANWAGGQALDLVADLTGGRVNELLAKREEIISNHTNFLGWQNYLKEKELSEEELKSLSRRVAGMSLVYCETSKMDERSQILELDKGGKTSATFVPLMTDDLFKKAKHKCKRLASNMDSEVFDEYVDKFLKKYWSYIRIAQAENGEIMEFSIRDTIPFLLSDGDVRGLEMALGDLTENLNKEGSSRAGKVVFNQMSGDRALILPLACSLGNSGSLKYLLRDEELVKAALIDFCASTGFKAETLEVKKDEKHLNYQVALTLNQSDKNNLFFAKEVDKSLLLESTRELIEGFPDSAITCAVASIISMHSAAKDMWVKAVMEKISKDIIAIQNEMEEKGEEIKENEVKAIGMKLRVASEDGVFENNRQEIIKFRDIKIEEIANGYSEKYSTKIKEKAHILVLKKAVELEHRYTFLEFGKGEIRNIFNEYFESDIKKALAFLSDSSTDLEEKIEEKNIEDNENNDLNESEISELSFGEILEEDSGSLDFGDSDSRLKGVIEEFVSLCLCEESKASARSEEIKRTLRDIKKSYEEVSSKDAFEELIEIRFLDVLSHIFKENEDEFGNKLVYSRIMKTEALSFIKDTVSKWVNYSEDFYWEDKIREFEFVYLEPGALNLVFKKVIDFIKSGLGGKYYFHEEAMERDITEGFIYFLSQKIYLDIKKELGKELLSKIKLKMARHQQREENIFINDFDAVEKFNQEIEERIKQISVNYDEKFMNELILGRMRDLTFGFFEDYIFENKVKLMNYLEPMINESYREHKFPKSLKNILIFDVIIELLESREERNLLSSVRIKSLKYIATLETLNNEGNGKKHIGNVLLDINDLVREEANRRGYKNKSLSSIGIPKRNLSEIEKQSEADILERRLSDKIGNEILKSQKRYYYDLILKNYCESMRANLVKILIESGFSAKLRSRKNEIEKNKESLITLFTGNALHNAVGFWREECIKVILANMSKECSKEIAISLAIVDDSNRTPGQIAIDIDKRESWYELLSEAFGRCEEYKDLFWEEKNRNFNSEFRESIRNLDGKLLKTLIKSSGDWKNRIDFEGLDYAGRSLEQIITKSEENEISEQDKLAFKGKVVQMFNNLGYKHIVRHILSEKKTKVNSIEFKEDKENIMNKAKGKENILIEGELC